MGLMITSSQIAANECLKNQKEKKAHAGRHYIAAEIKGRHHPPE
jgi:hypothetical protein